MRFAKVCRAVFFIFVPVALSSASPVRVRLHQPPPGQYALEHLWWVDLDNQTEDTYTCYLHGEIWEARRGLVFKGNSREFQLPPGRQRRQGRKDVDPLWDIWYAPGFEEFALRTGGLPEGNYRFIVLLQPDLGGDTVEFDVSRHGPPRLLSPRDGARLREGEKRPMFSWTPPQPPVPGVRYVVRVVEILPGQTKEEAMRANQSWFEKRGEARVSLRYPLSARNLEKARRYAWQVRAIDRNGNVIGESEIWAFSFEEIRPPPVRILPVNIGRQVTRTDNYYTVVLTIENNSGDTLRDLTVFDRSAAFQCIDDATVMHGTSGASYRSTFCRTQADSTGAHTAVMFGWEGLAPRGRMIVRYHVVPVLLPHSLERLITPTVGDSTAISYRIGEDWTLRCFRIPFLPADFADALRAADYLIITSPEKLFHANPGDMMEDVYKLLATMARLAKEKSGVLGYISASWRCDDVKGYFKDRLSFWGRKLNPNWLRSGYLLIVGQDDIVPPWSYPVRGFGNVPLSDYPYADLSGDKQCELRVGRIIGLNARELTIPIQTSLDVWQGRARYDGTHGLMVSAAEGPFEPFVVYSAELSDSLRLKVPDVFCIFGEQFITRMSMLREALWIDCAGDLFKLSRWMLREWVWNGHSLGTIDRLSEVESMTQQAVKDSAIALAHRLVSPPLRPPADTTAIAWVGKALEWDVLPWENNVPNREAYLNALAGWLLRQRGITPPADSLTRALREGEEIQYARRGERLLPLYNYFDTPEAAAGERSSYIRRMAPDRDIIGYCGHGGAGSWAWTLDDWATSACPAEPLSFGSHRPVVLGYTCSSGDYTESGDHGPVSIARCFLRNGAGVYVGATRVSFCCTNRTLYLETFRRWSTQEYFGDAFVDLKNTVCLREQNWILETVMYNLYGDPKYRRR
ncbi:MAG: C25 family cysteine peptidase [candidate division WOR-3 bacterium]